LHFASIVQRYSRDSLVEVGIFGEVQGRLLLGRSAILISYFFSTVIMADQINVLVRGRIIEHGSHAGLGDELALCDDVPYKGRSVSMVTQKYYF
jgi:hypothetical protein